MADQIFISYRRQGGATEAKLICEALKNKGYTVFYDFDSLRGGVFDRRIISAIEGCTDFIIVLPQGALDRCVNENDWVRQEIRVALKEGKNIIPVMLPGFSFPAHMPSDIAEVSRYNGVNFVIDYFDLAVIPSIINKLSTSISASGQDGSCKKEIRRTEKEAFDNDEWGSFYKKPAKPAVEDDDEWGSFYEKPVKPAAKDDNDGFASFSEELNCASKKKKRWW